MATTPTRIPAPSAWRTPGRCPVPNQRAVESAARIALALNCTVTRRTIFHRKNYFYPDSPKAYQISQYDEPLAVNGWFEYWVGEEKLRCRINRVHMEEDAAKLVHAGGDAGRIAGSDFVDGRLQPRRYAAHRDRERADIPSPEAAREFLQQLRNLVIELGVSECDMEEGQIRWDANVSVRAAGSEVLGTRTELKNMNSFRYLQQALEAEIPRQIAILEAGGNVDLETLHFDPDTGTTTPLRSKEEAHDYRYFPEPDLVPLVIDVAWVEELRATQPELPAARVARFTAQYGLSRGDALVLGSAHGLADFYEEVVGLGVGAKPAANWTMGEYLAHLDAAGLEAGHGHATAERLAKLVTLVENGTLSSSAAKDVFAKMIEERAEPEAVAEKYGLGQISDTAQLAAAVAAVVAANPGQVEQYRAGKQQVLGFFVGQVMKATGGRANPQVVNDLLRKHLEG